MDCLTEFKKPQSYKNTSSSQAKIITEDNTFLSRFVKSLKELLDFF